MTTSNPTDVAPLVSDDRDGARARLLLVCSCVALIWVLVARIVGPSDVWDQTQPKTVSYTSDIVANGHWILPFERGDLPATKPPLYNWLAAPAVWAAGYASEFAHKTPSIVALCLCWLLCLRLGKKIDSHRGLALGAMASMAFVANYALFKLGYLARPDMVLTLWLLLAWAAGTQLLIAARDRDDDASKRAVRMPRIAFWTAIALAALTKGPPAVAPILFVLLAAKPIGGSWRALRIFHWWWLPVSLAPIVAWGLLANRADPGYLAWMWETEIGGRITGTSEEGGQKGVIGILLGLPNMLAYYLIRFAPWSVLSILAMWRLVRAESGVRRWRALDQEDGAARAGGSWLMSAIIFIVVNIAMYSLSSGKRADYIASAYGPGALLAAWLLVSRWRTPGAKGVWFGVLAGGVTLTAVTVVNQLDPDAPAPYFGDNINEFVDRVAPHLADHPEPVLFWKTDASHLQAFLGLSEHDYGKSEDPIRFREAIAALDGPIWVLGGVRTNAKTMADHFASLEGWLADRGVRIEWEAVEQSAGSMPRAGSWPGQVTLYRVEVSHSAEVGE